MKKLLFLFATAFVLASCSSQDEVLNPINEEINESATTYAGIPSTATGTTLIYMQQSDPVYAYKNEGIRDYYYSKTKASTIQVNGLTYHYEEYIGNFIRETAPNIGRYYSNRPVLLCYDKTAKKHRLSRYPEDYLIDTNNGEPTYEIIARIGYPAPGSRMLPTDKGYTDVICEYIYIDYDSYKRLEYYSTLKLIGSGYPWGWVQANGIAEVYILE